MAYTSYDTPGEFFNAAPDSTAPATASGYSVANNAITFGCADHATIPSRFLTNLTGAQAQLTTGSTAQVLFALLEALYGRFRAIKQLSSTHVPTKFTMNRSGFTDEVTGELVYNYTMTCRLAPGAMVAVNA